MGKRTKKRNDRLPVHQFKYLQVNRTESCVFWSCPSLPAPFTLAYLHCAASSPFFGSAGQSDDSANRCTGTTLMRFRVGQSHDHHVEGGLAVSGLAPCSGSSLPASTSDVVTGQTPAGCLLDCLFESSCALILGSEDSSMIYSTPISFVKRNRNRRDLPANA